MGAIWVITNHEGHYWSRQKEWIGQDRCGHIQTYKFQDQALNELVELSSKDVTLRGQVICVDVDEKSAVVLPVTSAVGD